MMLPRARLRRKSFLLDFALVFLLAAALIWPLFKIKYADKWGSIESTFIADARFLKEHWPHPQWQPLWYGGTRFDYIYPPALRYGTAAIAKFYPMTEARAYHLYTAFFYCLGIAGVYYLVRIASGSRGASWLAAAGAALLSPSFLFLPHMRYDAWLHHPVRLGALVRYGEGPHITAFSLLTFALVASFFALRQWSPAATAAAGIACALVVSNNFYGATSLAISFPILVWSLWITHRNNRIWLRSLAIPVLAYGLMASWFTPSYLRVTLLNMRLVSSPGNTWSIWVALGVLAVYLAVSAILVKQPASFYIVFVTGFCLFFCLNVLGNHFFGFRVIGEPGRLIPELDLAIILLAVEGVRRLWNCSSIVPRAIAAAVVILAFATAIPYTRRAWSIIVPDHAYEDRVEYKMSEWMSANLPGVRAMATGSVRFWYNAWHNLPQLGGGSEQGTLNQISNVAYSQVTSDTQIESCIHWLQAFGVGAVIVHDKTSQEEYKDFADPQKFAGVLPVLFDSHRGDVVYGVPRRYPDIGRVVETSRITALPRMNPIGDRATVRGYAEALEKGPESRAVTTWEGIDAMRVQADVAAGQSVVLQVAYDPYWRAQSGGSPLAIREDPLGQMLIETPPGRHEIQLRFETPLENRIGKAVTLSTLLVVIGLIGFGWRKRVAP